MKIRYKIFLIALCVLFVSYVPIISSALGPEDVLNPASIIYFPSVVIQLAANEGNGIICVDACGPCSAWGPHHLLVDGECKIPDRVEDCYSISPPMEWEFINNNCIPLSGVYNYNNTIPHDPEEFANHDSPNIDYLIVFETGEIFSGQYMITNGTVQRISFIENSRTLTVNLEQTGNGTIELIAYFWLFYPSNIEAEQGYDVYADGKKIEHVQRTLSLFEIPFEKDTKEITIARKIP
ncbi:MAG: hypothetical protein OEL84_07745 [Nitrosopumilus sp.]|nr:hypothetical protein [Nitrosopumilus sp.]